MTTLKKLISTLFMLSFVLMANLVLAQEDGHMPGMRPTEEDARNVVKKPSYSPYAGRNFPTNVFWGDTHVHTYNSLDARGFGVTLSPEVAYPLCEGRRSDYF